MVVRLKDLQEGKTEKKKLTRLSDIQAESTKQTAELMRSGQLPSFDVRKSQLLQEAAKLPEPEILPGRTLPVVGPVLRGLDIVAENPVVQTIGEIGRAVYTPGAGLGNVAGLYRATESALEKVAPKLGTTLGGRVAKGAIKEAVTGFPIATGQALTQTGDLGEAVKGGLIGGALGAGLGAAGPLVKRGIVRLKDLKAGKPQPTETLGLPAPRLIEQKPMALAEQEGVPKTLLPEPVEAAVKRVPSVAPRVPVQKEYEAITSRLDDIEKPIARTLTDEQRANEIVDVVSQPRIRDRVYNYLDEAEQAARERIKARRNIGIVPAKGNEVVDWTIIGAAKLGKGTIKAADWTEEMVKEFGEDFRKHAPRIYKASQVELKNQVRKASKEGQEAYTFNESGTGNASTFRNKISYKKADQKEPFRKRVEKAYSQFVDDVTAFKGLEKRVTGQVASAEKSLYKAARLFKGMPEKANLFVRDRLGSIINNVEKQGISTQEFGEYALAVHAKDVNNAGYKSGMTNAEINDVISKYGSDAMENSRKQLIKVNDDLLEELINSDVISRESADIMRQKFPNYVPLFREFDDKSVEFGSGLSQALANVASPIKKLKGSERAVINPLENMVKNIFQSVNAAERNKVARQLERLTELDREGQYIRKLDPDEKVGRKNVVNVKINGENVKYEVEPEVYKTFFNMDQQSGNLLTDILSAPASVLRAGATLTPEFAIRNPFRDIPTAYVTSESGFTPFDFFYGLGSAIRGKQGKEGLYKEWIKNLGAYGQSLSMDRDVHKEALKAVLKQTPSEKFVNIINGKGLISLLRSISDTTEAATKIGEFRAALRTGATPEEAAYRARDLMDFARAGSAIRPTNRMVAFLNANIQGKDKLIRSFKRDKLGTTIRSLKAVTLPTVAIFAAQKYLANDTQKNTIKEAPDWQKDAFWLIPVPGTDTVARIPKPFDLAPVFSNSVEKALEYYYNNDKDAFDGFFKRSLSESSLPVQLTGLIPFIEGMSNYSFFRQGPIIPQREAGLAPSEQYDPIRTTETGKFLAKMVGKATGEEGQFKNFASPRIMDNTIQGITAGLGGYATSAIDSIVQGKVLGKKVFPPIVKRPEAPEKRLEQRPFIKAFTVDQLQGGKSTETFFKELDKLKTEKATNKQKGITFGKETAKKYYYLPKGKEKLLDDVTKSADRISDIGKEIRTIEKDTKLTGTQKRIKIEPLIKERNDITQREAQRLKQAKK